MGFKVLFTTNRSNKSSSVIIQQSSISVTRLAPPHLGAEEALTTLSRLLHCFVVFWTNPTPGPSCTSGFLSTRRQTLSSNFKKRQYIHSPHFNPLKSLPNLRNIKPKNNKWIGYSLYKVHTSGDLIFNCLRLAMLVDTEVSFLKAGFIVNLMFTFRVRHNFPMKKQSS